MRANYSKNYLMKRIIGFCLAFSLFSTSVFSYNSIVEDPYDNNEQVQNDTTSVILEETKSNPSNEPDNKSNDQNEEEAQSFTMMSLNIVYYIVHKYLQNQNFDK